MKKQVSKTGLLLLLALLLISTATWAQELTKEFNKEYTYQPGKMLNLSNRYGDVVVETNSGDQVIINVKVTLRFPNQERAEKLLSYIDVQFSETGDVFYAKTVIDEKFSFTGWGSESRRFSIDYTVKMPEKMDLTLANRYGNTELDVLSGYVNLDIKYGNLTASKLSRGNDKPMNTINLGYGKASIEEAGWIDATVRYAGDFSIDKSQAVLLDSRYSKIRIGTTSSVVGETKYDNVRIENINNLVLDAGYADISVSTLTKKLVFEGGYGAFNVETVNSDFESIEVDSKYMGVNLGIDPSASYNLDARVSYGGLRFNEDNFQHRTHIIQNNSTETSGVVGKAGSPAATVKITASYGTVRLSQ